MPIERDHAQQLSAWRLFTLRSWNMKPLAITYANPANICTYRYGLEDVGRRSFRAMPSETAPEVSGDYEQELYEEAYPSLV